MTRVRFILAAAGLVAIAAVVVVVWTVLAGHSSGLSAPRPAASDQTETTVAASGVSAVARKPIKSAIARRPITPSQQHLTEDMADLSESAAAVSASSASDTAARSDEEAALARRPLPKEIDTPTHSVYFVAGSNPVEFDGIRIGESEMVTNYY